MSSVETVRGPVDVASLGTTLMHEHVFLLNPEIMQNYGDAWWDEQERVTDAVGKLTELKQAGVDTIVDPTVIGLGRYLPRIARINEQVDLNIVVATGLYTFDAIPAFFQYRGPGTLLGGAEILVELFLRDIHEGIADTGIRAGLLKGVVEEPGLTPEQRRIHEAICEVHRQTGLPITVHTNAAHQTGRAALQMYREQDVELTKVVVGHAGDSNDLDYLMWIMDQGATVGCDRFGLDAFNSTADRIATIARLCAQGYADRIVLSHDASCFADMFTGEAGPALAQAAPNWHYLHITSDVLPELRAQGVSQEQVTTMLVDNPRRYFTATEN